MSQSAASHRTATHAAAHAPAAAPAAPAAPPELKPTTAWSYPFALAKGNVSDPQLYLAALSHAQGGFYPLGANGVWHGGIHFDGATASELKQVNGIACPADCEVIAYRLDTKYPQLDYPDGKKALYSTGFVLARFKLALPPAPAATPAPAPAAAPAHGTAAAAGASAGTHANAAPAPAPAAAPAAPPADEIQTFYVLFMHLLDWAGYQAAGQQPAPAAASKTAAAPVVQRPHFWKGKQHFRVGSKAPNQQARPALSATDQQIASDPLAALIGTFGQPDAQQQQSQANVLKVANAAATQPVGGARIRSEGGSAGRILGLLPSGGEVILGKPNAKGWAQISSIEQGKPVGPTVGQDPLQGVEQGWMYPKELESLIDPDALDSVVVVDPPYPMKAGAVIGYPGEYTRYQDSNTLPPEPAHPIAHMEIFADDSFQAFLDKSRARAKQLPDSQKNVLVMAKGAKLVPDPAAPTESIAAKTTVKETSKSPKSGRWVQVQPMKAPAPAPSASSAAHKKAAHPAHPKLQPDGSPLWIERTQLTSIGENGGQAWKDFPLDVGKASSGPTGFQYAIGRGTLDQQADDAKAIDDQGVHWWKVACGTDSGAAVSGWVCEKNHPQVSWQSAWAWPGFEKVDATSLALVDSFKRYLSITGSALPEDKQSFKAAAAAVNSSDFIVKVEQAISAQGSKDGTVTAADLSLALRQPWLAEALSRLIVKYESEWGGGMDKWNALSPLMKTVDGKGRWQAELSRIQKLQWWDAAAKAKGFPGDPKVHHFHPIGLIGNFIASISPLDELIRKIGDIIASGEGNYDAYNTGTKDVPGGGVGHSYMHPAAGTVTNKTINEILATDSLSGTDTNRMFATGKYQTIINTLRAAKTAMKLTGDEKYDADMQERVFREYLIYTAGNGALGDFVVKGKGTIYQAQLAAAECWASIAAPKGATIADGEVSDGTLSYHESAANSANMTSTNKLVDILKQIAQSRGMSTQ